ncbi:MAG: Fic family protein [Desulfosporosinus sp.]|nr:Fic family protein [Desulfosporosinus sp.]
MKDKFIKKEPLSLEFIKEIHKVLTSGTYDKRRYITNEERPGEFKKHDYVTGLHEVGSSAEDVESHHKELITVVNEYLGPNILKVAAYLHAKYEFIHPFPDGNGRVERTLLNYYLMINNHPPLIVYDEDKRLYYDSLQRYDEAEELSPGINF